jgi:hypothetical protein
MEAAELEACRVPEDPTFLEPTEGYVVSYVVFYERDSPCHRTSSSARFSGITTSRFTTLLPWGSCILRPL